jgi:hypothetical protein
MKGSILFTASILFVLFAASLEATTQPTPIVKSIPKANTVSVEPASQPAPVAKSLGQSSTLGPNLRQLNSNMGTQFRKLIDAQKSGKLTGDQAKSLKEKLKEIHRQKTAFLKTNGNRELNQEQADKLNQQLQTIGQSIP